MHNYYQTFEELRSSKALIDISYEDLLTTLEWRKRREEIIVRDRRRCRRCNKMETLIHHDDLTNKKVALWLIPELINNGHIERIESKIVVAKKPYHLHVHHKYYILDTVPWDYKNDALITLCQWCHWKVHKENTIPVFAKNEDKLIELEVCDRCNGAGRLPQFQYVQNGVCFKCEGHRYQRRIISF